MQELEDQEARKMQILSSPDKSEPKEVDNDIN
jgi:hypothetical protein